VKLISVGAWSRYRRGLPFIDKLTVGGGWLILDAKIFRQAPLVGETQ
jgi:hypothetical protein